jgi:phage host-nuclease inhibitor protein Gam
MPPARRKAPRQQAPTNIEEATGLLGKYAGIVTEAEQLRADADAAIAAIEAARDQALAPIEEEAKAIFLQLRAWWAVAGDTLTEGKRKSVELAGCLVGERTTPKKVIIGKMKVGEAIGNLVAAGLGQLVRWKGALDKPEILKALADDELQPKLAGLGFSAKQTDEFFIDRAAKAPADPEQVPLAEAAE